MGWVPNLATDEAETEEDEEDEADEDEDKDEEGAYEPIYCGIAEGAEVD